MKLRLLRRRRLAAVPPVRLAPVAAPPRDITDDSLDTRLFVACPQCKTITNLGTGLIPMMARCPNRHPFRFALTDLFYLDGTRPESTPA